MVFIRQSLMKACGRFKALVGCLPLVRSLVLPVTLCLACAFVSVGALATERIIADPNQQLALFGYDPVAYLADGRARVGAERYEVLYEDLVWRFANEGNLESFLEAPDTFVPAFGGYDAFMIGRGSATPGNPEIFVVVGTRVLLFRDEPARFAFNLEPEFLLARSDEIWPDVRLTLAP